MAQHHDFKVKNGLVVNDSGTFGNHITGTSATFSGTVIADNILDSGQVIGIVATNETPQDFAYSSLTGAPNVLDSANVSAIITADVDKAYVDALGVDYTTLANKPTFADSAWVTSQLDALIDGAPGTLDTLNEIAAALNDDDSAYATLVNLINAKSDLDSANISAIILDDVDAAYVQARETPQDFAYSSLTGAPNVLDSADIQSMMDSAGQAEATFNVVNNGTSAYTFTGDGFTSGRDNPTIYLIRGLTYRFYVQANGHPFEIRLSNGGSAYNTGVINNGSEMDDVIFTPDMNAPRNLVYQCTIHSGMVGNIVIIDEPSYLDSANVSSIITTDVDAAYVQARETPQDFAYSSLTGTPNILDSVNITNLIDSAYVAARTSPSTGTDSATVVSIITDTVDQAYVEALGISAGLDSANIITLIDSAYVQARQIISGGGGGSGLAFGHVNVSGQDIIDADSSRDTLTFEAGPGITLTTDPNTDTVTIIGHLATSHLADGINVEKYQYIAESAQTAFSDSDDNGNVLIYNPNAGQINVYVNGILLIDSDDFTQTDSATLTLIDPATLGDRLTIVKYTPPEAATIDSDAVKGIIDSDWVQARQTIFARGELEINKYYYTATAAQAVFTGIDNFGNELDVVAANTEVYMNGVQLVNSNDYTITNDTLTLVDAADSGYSVAIIETIGKVMQPRGFQETTYYYTTPTPVTTITGADDNNLTLDLSIGTASVYLNGLFLKNISDYSTTSSAVELVSSTDSGDLVSIVNRKGTVVTPTLRSFEFTADSGQTTISGIDDAGYTLSYVNGQVELFLNGIRLRESIDYTANNGSSVVLTNPLDSADDIVINAFAAPGVYLNKFIFNADSAQTVFFGADRDNNAFVYEAGNYNVFLNGILLTDSDYIGTNGKSLTLTSGANLNDELVIVSYDTGLSTRRLNTWSAPTGGSYQLAAGDKVFIETVAPRTVTLPVIAVLGDEIRVIDATGNAATNNITIDRNGHKIQAADSDFTIDIDRAAIGLVYYNLTQGWLLTEK